MNIDEKDDLVKRMANAYRKRRRQKKVNKLKANDNHWSGLEETETSRKLITFAEWRMECNRRLLEKQYNA